MCAVRYGYKHSYRHRVYLRMVSGRGREDRGRPHRVRRASIRCDVREIGSPESLNVADRAYFGPGLLRFLKDLRLHNEREWFLANQQRYEEDVRGPFLRLIADLAPGVKKISPNLGD